MNDIVEPRQVASAAAEANVQRAMAEIQAQVMVAMKFPRDRNQAMSEIMEECSRPALAETAMYEYAKGGSAISGASIRLAETIATAWGRINSGWRELGRVKIEGIMYAEIEAYAWDLERMKVESVTFKAKLHRDTRKGSYPLKDEREIYEHCANQAKRRERACILSLIPGYVVDQALDQCKRTLAETVKPETTQKMIAAFKDNYGVSQEQIEVFIQRNIDAIQPGQVVRLRQIYNSLKDGMATASEFFPPIEEETEQKKGVEGLKDTLAKKSLDKFGSQSSTDQEQSLDSTESTESSNSSEQKTLDSAQSETPNTSELMNVAKENQTASQSSLLEDEVST